MDAQWLNRQFELYPEKNKSDLSQLLGMQASGISKILAGTRQIKAKEYLLMRKFFDMPGHGQTVERKPKNIQSYDKIWVEDKASGEWVGAVGEPDYKIIEVIDSAMVPDFLPGERVLIDTRIKTVEKSGIFAFQDQGVALIRILEQNSSKIKIIALSKSAVPQTVMSNKIKIMGRVIAKLNWL